MRINQSAYKEENPVKTSTNPYRKDDLMNTHATRNPLIPASWVRQLDPDTGEPTNIYSGPVSRNGIIQVYALDRGPDLDPLIEYSTEMSFPDMSAQDVDEFIDELTEFRAKHSAGGVSTPRVADLNKALNPKTLSHYVRVGDYDAEVMGGPRAVAACGYRRSGRNRADVNGYARAREAGRLVCPTCHVLVSLMRSKKEAA